MGLTRSRFWTCREYPGFQSSDWGQKYPKKTAKVFSPDAPHPRAMTATVRSHTMARYGRLPMWPILPVLPVSRTRNWRLLKYRILTRVSCLFWPFPAVRCLARRSYRIWKGTRVTIDVINRIQGSHCFVTNSSTVPYCPRNDISLFRALRLHLSDRESSSSGRIITGVERRPW